MPRRLADPIRFFALALAFEGGVLLVGLVAGMWMSPHPLELAHWSAQSVLLGIVWSLPMLVVLVLMRQCRFHAIGHLNQTIDRLLVPLFRQMALWQLALISAVAGFGEELLFRGVLQQVLADHLGIAAGIGVTSILFGLVHWVTPLYGILAGGVSVFFGWLFVRYGDLTPPIVTHGLYDFVALVYLIRSAVDERSIEC
jgi:membrane protease YdiL (CAAX protease family)